MLRLQKRLERYGAHRPEGTLSTLLRLPSTFGGASVTWPSNFWGQASPSLPRVTPWGNSTVRSFSAPHKFLQFVSACLNFLMWEMWLVRTPSYFGTQTVTATECKERLSCYGSGYASFPAASVVFSLLLSPWEQTVLLWVAGTLPGCDHIIRGHSNEAKMDEWKTKWRARRPSSWMLLPFPATAFQNIPVLGKRSST